ncbi:MAG: zinc ribbon domain-containing protein [Slackia faecicanis]|nr:zinc ribbon domain-containing protein [Slackia faecicanis]
MAKFCTWCGAPLEPGARFCGECGGRILETVMVDGTKKQVDTLSGFDIVDGRQLPADATLRLDRDSVVVNTDNKQKRFSLDSAKRPRKTALIAAATVIVLLLAAAGVLAAAYFGGWGGDQQKEPIAVSGVDDKAPAPEASQQDAASDLDKDSAEAPDKAQDESSSAKIDDKSQVKLTEAEIFNSLDAAYGKLSSYDERIGTCVEEFNANFLANSMPTRTASKEFADKVLADLQNDLKGIEAMHIPSQSAYAEQAQTVIELYECQVGRVSALTNAWALDVTFEKPSEHKDEILATYTQGKAKSHLDRYDELYDAAKPEKVS